MSGKGLGNDSLEAIKDWLNSRILSVYPVGSIYMSTANVSPATFIGGEWEALDDGRVLIGAGSAHPAGETGGEEEHTLSEGEMPSHSHNGSLSGSTKSAGSHSHSRGSMDITGKLPTEIQTTRNSTSSASGAFSSSALGKWGHNGTYSYSYDISFKASNNWTGTTSSAGSHSHSLEGVSVTTSSAGGSGAHNNMPPYLSVYMWKRIA